MGQIALQVPQVGVANATEDVKVASDFTTLQTLVNGNLDPTNMTPGGGIMHLAFRSVVGSTSLAVGDWAVCVPSISVALPAPTANGLIALTMGAGVTGSAQVTVTGTNIWLPSAPSSVSSFTQGSQLTTLVLQSDGTSWITMAGRRDTGWVSLPYSTGWSQGSGPAAQARATGDTVYLRGQAQNGTGGTVTVGSISIAVPATFTPSVQRNLICGGSVAGVFFNIQVAGTTLAMTGSPGISNGQWLSLEGLSYSL